MAVDDITIYEYIILERVPVTAIKTAELSAKTLN